MAVAVLFDLEDTLIETPWASHERVLEFRRKTKEKLIEVGIPASLLEGVERATMMRNKSIEYIEKNLTKKEAEKIYQEMEKFLNHYELDSANRSKLFPDTILTLEKLRRIGVKIGLVTNTSMKAVDIVFQRHGLKNYFSVVVTRENVKKLKPDPEGIFLALKKLGADSFFMIGDLVHDALAAKSARGTSIIIKRNPEEKIDFEADHVIQSLNDAPKIIQATMKTIAKG